VDSCAARLPALGAAIIWTSVSANSLVLAATSGVAAELETAQFAVGEGPQLTCVALRRPVLQPQLESNGGAIWPAFTPEALERGVRSVFAFPLNVGAISVGVLDVYRDAAELLSGEQLAIALAYAEAATALLLNSADRRDPVALPPRFEEAFLLQAEVHQATGMIAVQTGSDLRTALALLHGRSFALERAVLDVARDVVSRVIRFT
jgi:hypothetical protein